jgi:ATP-binding cassette subfamily B protein
MRQENRLREEFGEINQQHNTSLMKNIRLNSLMLRPAVFSLYLLVLIIMLSFFGIK